ncbi:MAG TPA: type II secretion system F family protein [Acidimicrobiia bacterium]|nr:type II secretion system F family protein [Acidimicrobiia bacterium]
MTPVMVLAAGASAVVMAGLMWLLVPPTPRLSGRVRPYVSPGLSASPAARTSVARVFGPILARLATAVGRRLDPSGDDGLARRLRQAGLFPDLDDAPRVAAFRLAQLRALVVGAAGAGLVAAALDLSTAGIVGLAIVGAVAGVGRTRGRIERTLESRRLRMRIEIYTIDQLLALRVRVGGGVIQAVNQVIARGRGEVVEELAEAVRLHRAGLTVAEAFGRVADATPESACGRTYRLLAIADERGVDLAAGLLALAEDVRETRREAMKRAATRRRAAMLVPTIALLAPTLLLFVAAPLPYLLTGWR